jgi:hypothetical protein
MTDSKRESVRKAQRKYQKKLKTYILRFRMEQDADVIAQLEHVGSKTGFIRELIRRDIREHPEA